MRETQQTISDWANNTFGPTPSGASILARANSEMAELLRKVTSSNVPSFKEIAEEAADVIIVLTRFVHLNDYSFGKSDFLEAVCEAQINAFSFALIERVPSTSHPQFQEKAMEANYHLARAMRRFADDKDAKIENEIYNLVYALCHLCSICHTHLGVAIDEKMAINRARKWKLGGDGHGQHIPEDDEK